MSGFDLTSVHQNARKSLQSQQYMLVLFLLQFHLFSHWKHLLRNLLHLQPVFLFQLLKSFLPYLSRMYLLYSLKMSYRLSYPDCCQFHLLRLPFSMSFHPLLYRFPGMHTEQDMYMQKYIQHRQCFFLLMHQRLYFQRLS